MGKARRDPGDAEKRRVSIRQWAILYARNSDEITADDDGWDIDYDPDLVTWLARMMRAFREYELTPVDLIETELRYPGLLNALDKAFWQLEIQLEYIKDG